MTDKWQAGTTYEPGALVIPTSAPATASNSPTNADFESGASGWALGTGWVIANVGGSVAFSGTWNATCSGAGTAEIKNNNVVAAVPGQSITASCRTKATGANATKGNVFIEWQDVAHARISVSSGNANLAADGHYELSTVTAVAPAGTKYARIAANAVVVGAGTVAVDAFTWTYVAPATAPTLMYENTAGSAATSASAEPTWPLVLGGTVTDGGITWTAVTTNRVVWTAQAILVSGTVEPTWPTRAGSVIADGSIQWTAESRQVTDANCPNTAVVCKGASKIFAGDSDITRFSATVNPLDWTSADDAGYLPTGMQQGNANDVAVLNIYRKKLVMFNANGFQMWDIDPDPANMAIADQLPIGSTWQKACVPVGNDLYFLAALGVRSIGIAVAAENLQAGDIGMPVDPLVQAAIASGVEPLGAYLPSAGQYWLSFPNYPTNSTTTYVFTLNGSSGKWSRYVHPFVIEAYAQLGNDLYMRHGNYVSKVDPTLNTDAVAGVATAFAGLVQSPWLDLGAAGETKDLHGFDYTGDGQGPSVSVGYDQRDTAAFTAPFAISNDTVPGTPIPFGIMSPSLSFKLAYAGGAAWSFDRMNLYLSDLPGQP